MKKIYKWLISEDGKTLFIKTIDDLFRDEYGREWAVKTKNREGRIQLKIIARIPQDKERIIDYLVNKINSEKNPDYKRYYDYIIGIYIPKSKK